MNRQKIASLAMLLVLAFGLVPWQAMVAADTTPHVTRITINRTYGSIGNSYIEIEGSNLLNAKVSVKKELGDYTPLTNRIVNTNQLLQFSLTESGLQGVLVEGADNGVINFPTGFQKMPVITDLTPTTFVKGVTTGLVITGSGFLSDDSYQFEVGIGRGEIYANVTQLFKAKAATDTQIQFAQDEISSLGLLGLQNIRFVRTANVAVNNSTVSIAINHLYWHQFRIVEDTSTHPTIEMFPNKGEKGDNITFTISADVLYDIFFLKKLDGTDPYTYQNRAPFVSYEHIDDKWVLTAKVPEVSIGEYYVVLTNPISAGKDPMEEVYREIVLTDPFVVVDANNKARIVGVSPAEGPDTGTPEGATPTLIQGFYLGSLNVDKLKAAGNTPQILFDDQNRVLKIDYGPGTYDGRDTENIIKTVRAYIGDSVYFDDQAKNPANYKGLDNLYVRIPEINIGAQDTKKDVVVTTETVFTVGDKTYRLTERAVLPLGYTFVSSIVNPQIDAVVPEKVQVENNLAPGLPYVTTTKTDLRVAIYGKNFFVNRYLQSDGTPVVVYPTVQFGTIPTVFSNEPGKQLLTVLNDQGLVVDGTKGNEFGTKILLTIPRGTGVTGVGKTSVTVGNPRRNSNERIYKTELDKIEFVNVDPGKVPVIESVTPQVVTTKGGEEVTILGSNFQNEVKVFIDGAEVTPVTRSGDGRKITLQAPPGREGFTQLQVMNPEGGVDTFYPFRYVKTYTEPTIIDFAPKFGTAGTLVVIAGQNFLKPDPTAAAEEIDKLLGTRVLLEGKDVNEYNIDPVTKQIALQPYVSDEPLLAADASGKVVAAEYWHSVILEDEAHQKYYTVEVDASGNVTVTDGQYNKFSIVYSASAQGLTAVRGAAAPYAVTVDTGTIAIGTIPAITLRIKTPYRVDNGTIIGHRVKVVDSGHIYFTVPNLPADGWYDVTVLNPDTSKDSKTDTAGFYYYSKPQSNPVIRDVVPDAGSVDGGYVIDVIGDAKSFIDSGIIKTKVFVNGIEIKATDTTVSPDGSRITVKIPPYPGDLRKDKGVDRLTVPLVVVNPDGQTVIWAQGFTYVVPSSHPAITRIYPAQGTAAGGDVVEIYGFDLRPNEAGRLDLTDPNWRQKITTKVFFGLHEAEVLEWSPENDYIKVRSPSAVPGKAEVYIVTTDSLSNKVPFTYLASSPKISQIVPGQGRKQGNENVEILGSGFIQIPIRNEQGEINWLPPYVRFGTITNGDIPREAENSGRIDNGRTSVTLAGGLTVSYNGSAAGAELTLAITEGNKTYSGTFSFAGQAVYLPVDELRDGENNRYAGHELIRVEIADRRLLVERGYSPLVTFVSSRQLLVSTPSYYTAEKVTVTVINPDGGKAQGEFVYRNPASRPTIKDVQQDGKPPVLINNQLIVKLSLQGGNTVTVIGTDFREKAQIQISNILTVKPQDILYELSPDGQNDRLTFTLPKISETALGTLHRLRVINEDAGIASSDTLVAGRTYPIFLEFVKGESAPAISKLYPDKGPAEGGTLVTIEGQDFRVDPDTGKKPAVYFGTVQVPEEDVTWVNYKTIVVITPPHEPGEVDVKVENPDGTLTNPAGRFTYLSSPAVTAVVHPADDKQLVPVISVEGGDLVALKGSGFMEGARVLFAPVLKEASAGKDNGREIIFIHGKTYVLTGGEEGLDVAVINSETITVKTPPGILGSRGVMVINPDGGASDVYDAVEYGLPELPAPAGVTAELVDNQYIRVTWTKVEKAAAYDVFVSIDNGPLSYVGSTEITGYIFADLEPSTRYRFVVQAVGDYGSSPPSLKSNWVKTGKTIYIPDDDGKIAEHTAMARDGATARITIGTSDFDERDAVIDLTRGALAGSREVVIAIPALAVASDDARDITVIGADFLLTFNPSVFNVSRLASNKNRRDAGVRFTIAPLAGYTGAPTGASLSPVYLLAASVFIGQDSFTLDRLPAALEFSLTFDGAKARMRRVQNVSLNRWEESSGTWEPITSGFWDGLNPTLSARIDRLGKYVIQGGRK